MTGRGLYEKMLQAVSQAEEAEQRAAAAKKRLELRAEKQASEPKLAAAAWRKTDPAFQAAVSDNRWYMEKAQMYALAALAASKYDGS